MPQVIDYSWARPNLTQVKANGYEGVIRYLAHDTTGKAITLNEANQIRGAGLGLALVFEDAAREALNGHDAGVSDATFALAQANALSFPTDRPIYFAVDTQAADNQLGAVDAYFLGVSSVIGQARTGIYGDYKIVTHYAGLGYKWLWQTLAWSAGAVDNNAQLYQNGQSAFSGGADIDVVQQADWGAWAAGAPAAGNPTPTPAPNPAQASGPGGTYTVASGDGLIKIGAKLGVDWHAIANLNHISSPYTIFVGQVLAIPGGGSSSAPVPTSGRYIIQSGDTLSGIGAKLGVSWTSIASANNINSPYTIYPGQTLVIPNGGSSAPAVKTYRVASGDTLSGIGAKLGVNWQTIAQLNGINSPFTIYPNELLRLP